MKDRSANASLAARRLTPNGWKQYPGRATASSVRKSSNRDAWKKLHASQAFPNSLTVAAMAAVAVAAADFSFSRLAPDLARRLTDCRSAPVLRLRRVAR